MRHEDVRTNGIPDLSLTGRGLTSWWECKHGNPDFESKGIQELTMRRLAYFGFARYVVWQEMDGERKTLIVHPENIRTLIVEAGCHEFDMPWLVNYMRTVHETTDCR